MIDDVLIVGGGSAGLLTALALKRASPERAVTLLRDPNTPVIGVGESTTRVLPDFLHNHLGLDRAAFYEAVRPVFKGSVRLFFGPLPSFDYPFEDQMTLRLLHPDLPKTVGCYALEDMRTLSLPRATADLGLSPFLDDGQGGLMPVAPLGYHLENRRLVPHLESVARSRGVLIEEGQVEAVRQSPTGDVSALILRDGRLKSASLYVDATGFRGALLRRGLEEPWVSFGSSLFCDRALVAEYDRGDEPVETYTGCVALGSGWVFKIGHPEHVSVGYVHASPFIDGGRALAELEAWAPRPLRGLRMIPFESGRLARAWVGNVVAIGNACGFVEPLQSTALQVTCNLAGALANVLTESGGRVSGPFIEHFNHVFRREWDEIRRFLSLHFKLNGRLNTPFWQAARAETDTAGAEPLLEAWRVGGPTDLFLGALPLFEGCFGWDGYATLFGGMGVATEVSGRISPAEQRAWRGILDQIEARAAQALSRDEAWARLRSESLPWEDLHELRASV